MNQPGLQQIAALLRCPRTGQPLEASGGRWVAAGGQSSYRVNDAGVPLFAESLLSSEGRRQQEHYDRIADAYVENLSYPHTQEYSAYLDRMLTQALPSDGLGTVLELCCGRGELSQLVADRVTRAVGVDVSEQMLSSAVATHEGKPWTFIQGDATKLPLADASFDNVFILGGVHHVPDRQKLFQEVSRVLKPGGRLFFREPLSDFAPWRLLRAVIYRLSPTLDHETERPLLYEETNPPLEQAGLKLSHWSTHGFLGFCVLMNSDVLLFNRLFRFVPGIRQVTRLAAAIDEQTLHLPGLKGAGLQVVGVAEKPGSASKSA